MKVAIVGSGIAGLAAARALNGRAEITLFGAVSDDRTVKGENSIPAAFGGGEADISFQSINIGVSYGLRFGKKD